MTISRCFVASAAALLLCLDPSARATSLAAEPSQKPFPAQPQAQTQTQTQIQTQIQPAPIFSLGTISVAPSSQCFAGPAFNAGIANKPQTSRPRHPVRRSRRVAEPVPLRTYSRA